MMTEQYFWDAAGHEPVSQSYTKTTRQCKVSFNCNYCVGCPYQGQCRPKIDGWNATFITSKNASNRAKSQRCMQSEEFSNYAKLRNGVETVPANIRKNYRLDKLPRGKQRAKFFFGSKIAALNFRKLFGFRKGLVNYAQNPIFGYRKNKMTKIHSMKNKHPERQPQKAISSGCSFQRYFSSSLLLVIHKRLVLTPASCH